MLIFLGLLAVVDYVYFSPHLKNSPTLNKKIHRMVCLIANCARHHKTIRSASETKATERYFLKNYIKTILNYVNLKQNKTLMINFLRVKMSARFLQTLASKSRTFKFKIFDITFLLHLTTAYRYVDLEFDIRKLISKYHICLHTDLKVG